MLAGLKWCQSVIILHQPYHVLALQLLKPWLRLAAGRGDWFKRLVCWLLWLSRHGSGIWPLYMQLLPREEEMCSLMNFAPEERSELQCPDMEALAEKVGAAMHCLHPTPGFAVGVIGCN